MSSMHTQVIWPDSAIPTLTLDEAYRVLEHDGTSDSVELDAMQEEIIQDIERRRAKLLEVLQQRRLQRVMDGKGAKSLIESMETLLTPHGLRITAATYAGVGYKNGVNEDRIAIDTENEYINVIDGVGGTGMGERAAHLSAIAFMQKPGDLLEGGLLAQQAFMNENLPSGSGVCTQGIQFVFDQQNNMYLNAQQAGDVRLIIINPDNTLDHESKDENLIDELVANGAISFDEGLCSPYRNYVSNSISADNQVRATTSCDKRPLTPGQRIILASDGVTDNLTTHELLKIIEGRSAEEAIGEVNRIITERITNKKEIMAKTGDRSKCKVCSDGYILPPKADNISLVIIDLPSY